MTPWLWLSALGIWFLLGLLFAVTFFAGVHSEEERIAANPPGDRHRSGWSRYRRPGA